MKKFTLFLLLVSFGFQAVAKVPLKTIGKIVLTPLVAVGTSHTKTSKKKHKVSAFPAVVAAPAVAQAVPVIAENMTLEVDPEMVTAYEQMMVSGAAGDMLESVTPTASEAPAIAVLGVREKATQWIKNAWDNVPSMQMMKTNCINAADETLFYANKHRTVIAATVVAAAVIGGGYYWYKKSNVAKKQQN
jgi:hypothetical protein